MDSFKERSYGAVPVGKGRRPGIVVVDYQIAFTDKNYPLGGAPLVERGVENTARVLAVARACNIPVAACYTAYLDERDAPHWKVAAVREQFRIDHPGSRLDPRIHDRDYDLVVRKTGPSIFFYTPVVPYFIKQGVDTVIVTGCVTSGCVRASVIDSFQFGFRTLVPEDCVGDHEEQPHRDNLRDIERRYADITSSDEVIAYLEECRARND
ncbi:MAG TPA: isochorismatase family protein [Alphaproteobacteria bacterium]|nr:isochorismatase family protein [Alphaproteobacteria bacterium]